MLSDDVRDVLSGERKYAVQRADAMDFLRSLPADSVSCVIGSPPYCDARHYLENGENLGISRTCLEWVEWMLAVTEAASRVCVGPVFWVVGGVTRERNYWPACEGLLWEWWKLGGTHQLYRPCAWTRCGIPGSGGNDYLRADWEYVLCFKRPGALPWADNTACGKPPKWAPGGTMSHRLADGQRVNQWGMRVDDEDVPVATVRGGDGHGCRTDERHRRTKKPSHRVVKKMYTRNANGVRDSEAEEHYTPPTLANPGNVIHIPVGGGLLGSDLAHANEAPYPEELAAFFVRSFAPPDGIVCDPYSGSGTTLKVALVHGRRFVGCDLRESQVVLSKRRALEATPWKKDESLPGEPLPLFKEM